MVSCIHFFDNLSRNNIVEGHSTQITAGNEEVLSENYSPASKHRNFKSIKRFWNKRKYTRHQIPDFNAWVNWKTSKMGGFWIQLDVCNTWNGFAIGKKRLFLKWLHIIFPILEVKYHTRTQSSKVPTAMYYAEEAVLTMQLFKLMLSNSFKLRF